MSYLLINLLLMILNFIKYGLVIIYDNIRFDIRKL